jgi:hypothetical protein
MAQNGAGGNPGAITGKGGEPGAGEKSKKSRARAVVAARAAASRRPHFRGRSN